MILLYLIVILLAGGLLAWAVGRWSVLAARCVSLIAVCADFVIGLNLWIRTASGVELLQQRAWLSELDWSWIPSFGIHFHLALDGLSLLLLMLTFLLGIMSVLASWTEIQEAVGFFHLNLLWVLAGIVGVFLAMDLFLFCFAWELMLVPMFFLIAIWGHERRVYAAVKFFLFTQLSGLLMLVAIMALYLAHHTATGVFTFEYEDLLGTPLSTHAALWIMLGFFVAFAVKLPMFPLHTWLPDAHTQAPTAGSVILAGLLLKTGAYGLLRFVIPLFPAAAQAFAPFVMVLAVIGILYGAILAFAQTDLKRLAAYTSVSHLGFVLLAIFAWNKLALQGALITIVCHGVSTGALFILVGALQERLHTREITRMSGLWETAPRMGGAGLFFALASMGLPGLGDFVGEFMILLGVYHKSRLLTALAAVGILASTFYALKFVQGVFHGPNKHHWTVPDLGMREAIIFAPMIVILLWLGLYPQPVFNTFNPAMEKLQQQAGQTLHVSRR
jgi:NADH-quinone oxidoreductase subunit M